MAKFKKTTAKPVGPKAPDKKGPWIEQQKKVLGQARTACKGAKLKKK